MSNITSPLTARPTVYKGIEMRSRLEAWCAATLDAEGLEWEYEPCAFANEHGQYLPDFRLPDPDGKTLYIEMKGYVYNVEPIMRRMEIIWSSEPRVGLVIVQGHWERKWFGARKESPVWREME